MPVAGHQPLFADITIDTTTYPVSQFEITEAISRAWRGTVVVLSDQIIDLQHSLTKNITLNCQDNAGQIRQWVGLVLGYEARTLAPGLTEYRWSVGSFLCTLKQQIIRYTTYCNQDTKSTIEQVLHLAKAWCMVQDWQLSTRLPIHPMAVQLNESIYDFMARRCAMDNILWYSHTQDGVECISFVDHPNALARWPLIPCDSPGERRAHLCLSTGDHMTEVSDWEDLPIDRLYRGVPSLGVGTRVPGVWIKPYIPLDYDISASQAGLAAREQDLEQASTFYDSIDHASSDLRVSIMTLLEYEQTPYRVHHVTHYGTRLENKLYYHHQAVLVTVDHSWRGICPPWPKIPALLQGRVESHSEAPALDEQGRVYVKMLADTRMMEPCTASVGIPYCGFPFPLQPGTLVAIGFMYDEPDLPVVLGTLFTGLEKNQHKLVTPAGHALLISDDPSSPYIRLGHRDLGLSLSSGESPRIAMTCVGGMIFQAQGELRLKAAGPWTTAVNGMAVLHARVSHQMGAKDGEIALEAAKDLRIETQRHIEISTIKDLNLAVQGQHRLSMGQGESLTLSQGDMCVKIHGDMHMNIEKQCNINANTGSVLMTAVAGKAGFRLNPSGIITLHGKLIRFDCDSLVMNGHVRMGGKRSIPAMPVIQKIPALVHQPLMRWVHEGEARVLTLMPKISIRYPNTALSYVPLSHGVDYQYGTQEGSACVWGVKLRIARVEAAHQLKRIVVGKVKKLRIWSTETTQIICQQSGRPLSCVTHDISEITSETVIEILCLPPPVIINVRQDRAAYSRHSRNVLTAAELNYFKENGGNATLFIHGFNVDFGEYGSNHQIKHWLRHHMNPRELKDSDFSEATVPYSVRHAYADVISNEDLNALINAKTRHANLVMHPLREQFYDRGGGEGAHSWFVNMEYNLNARAGFAGDYRDPRYSRVIGVAWSGDVPVPYYIAAEHFADVAAARLVQLIRQLVKAEIKIHIVAHSLGNRVLLMLLHALGSDPAYRQCIDTAFLWQAAVPDTAIIDMKGIDTSVKQNWKTYYAIHAVKHMRVLYSRSDVSTLGVSYEAATKLGISPACFVKQASYCPPEDNQALLIHGGTRRPLTGRLLVRPPLGLRGEQGYQGDFKAIGEAFRERYKDKLTFIDLSELSLGHSYMKVKDYISSADVYRKGFDQSSYTLGTYGN